MRFFIIGKQFGWGLAAGLIIAGLLFAAPARGDEPPNPQTRDLAAAAQLSGRIIEEIRIEGNSLTSSTAIRKLVRSRVGDKFDPATVVEDYQRAYDRMKTFANVEAHVQPTETGVIVVFVVKEQKQISEISFRGNIKIKTEDLRKVVDIKKGEAIDIFRINLTRQAIEKLYHGKNFPFAHASISMTDLAKTGDVIFDIVEGPYVTIRKIEFIGNNTFSAWTLVGQIKTTDYFPVIQSGTFDPEMVDEDVDALRKYYNGKGFFDARVGRKLAFSPDQSEMQISFVIDEGPRYVIDKVDFKGVQSVPLNNLREELKEVEGVPYDKDAVDRDIRQMVRVYSKAGGFVYDQTQSDSQYLQIAAKPIFKSEPGKVDLVYEVHEGNQFRLGRILIKGNSRTQDVVIWLLMRMRPGDPYNSAEVEDATDRLNGTPYFKPNVTITPIGDDPHVRDLLVEVNEEHTTQITFGVGINSNGGLAGNAGYRQSNFDIGNPPSSWDEAFSDRAWTGRGQDFSANLSPGTQDTSASVKFTEPHLFDQPYSFSTQAYLEDRIREDYDDNRLGTSVTLGENFDYVYSASVTLGAQIVDIKHIDTPEIRAPEINAAHGHHPLTDLGLVFRRDTTNHGPVAFKGTDTSIGVDEYGLLTGAHFTQITLSFNDYELLGEDLLDRKTVLNTHLESGWNPKDAPFYERFYGGGLGSVRGFEFRGISPRSGLANDRIGGNFSITGGVELGFPLAEDFLRGVVFVDAGDVEHNARVSVIRSSAGFGVRLKLSTLFGQAPLALDFGFPITQNRLDQTQVLSFSFGVNR